MHNNRDGGLACYASSKEAFGLSFDEFLELICKEDTVALTHGSRTVGGITAREYEDCHRAVENEKMQKRKRSV